MKSSAFWLVLRGQQRLVSERLMRRAAGTPELRELRARAAERQVLLAR
jgi:hypothetical protein